MVAVAHLLRQVDLLLGGEQGDLADLLEVHAHGVVDGEAVHQGIGIDQLLLFDVRDLIQGRVYVVGDLREDVLLAADLDGQHLQRVIDLLHLIAVQVDLVQDLHHLRRIQTAPLLAPGKQVHDLLVGQQDGRRGQGRHHLVRQAGVFLVALRLLILGGVFRPRCKLFLLFCHDCFPPLPFFCLYFSTAASRGSPGRSPCRFSAERSITCM